MIAWEIQERWPCDEVSHALVRRMPSILQICVVFEMEQRFVICVMDMKDAAVWFTSHLSTIQAVLDRHAGAKSISVPREYGEVHCEAERHFHWLHRPLGEHGAPFGRRNSLPATINLA